MSKFLERLTTSHTLAIAAAEEASRWDRHRVDVEHLLLALVITEQRAGCVLRGAGVTLDDARQAVQEQHAEQLESLGIGSGMPDAGRIRFHEIRDADLDWSDRALEVLKRAAGRKRRGDASDVLRELLKEPSGFIRDVVQRLGTTPEEIARRLGDTEQAVPQPDHTADPDRVTATRRAFVPTAVGHVWELVSDPARLPEWDALAEKVEWDNEGLWRVRSNTEAPNGKPIRTRKGAEYRHMELLASKEPERIEWQVTFPGLKQSRPHTRTVELTASEGGTEVRVTVTWNRTARGLKRALGTVLVPAFRPVLWLQASQLANGISLSFR